MTVTLRNSQGQLFDVDPSEAHAALTADPDLKRATPEEVTQYDAAKAQREKYGTAGQQALGLAEKATGAATFGLIPKLAGSDEEAKARKEETERQSPFLSLGAEAAGTALPALAGGAVLEGGAAALGAGARLAGGAGVLGEGIAGGIAQEAERVRQTNESIDYWDGTMWGIGGAVLGHGLAAVARGAVGGLDNVLASAERKALSSDAKLARGLEGPERAKVFARAGEKIADDIAEEVTPALEKATARYEEMRDLGRYRPQLEELAQTPSKAARQWAADTSQWISQTKGDLPTNKALDQALNTLIDPTSDSVDILVDSSAAIRALESEPSAGYIREVLSKGIEDSALFGDASDLVSRVNRAPVADLGNVKVRRLLTDDPLTTKQPRARLDQLLGSMDELAETHRTYRLSDPVDLDKSVSTVRRGLTDGDEIRLAAAQQEVTSTKDVVGNIAGAVIGNKAENVIGGIGAGIGYAVGGPVGAAVGGYGARKAYEAVVTNMSGAQRVAVVRAARGFVRRTGQAVEVVKPGPVGMSAVRLFQGDYSSAEASYQSKVDAIRIAQSDPSVLPRVLAASFGELPVHLPRAFANASAQTNAAFNYLAANLPVGVAATMVSPRGLPPSRQTIREFALLWNSVTAPETVLESLADGTAVPRQIEALKAVHPWMYDQLQADIRMEIARSPETISTQTKLWLDILFEGDGSAGLAYSWEAGLMFRPAPPEQQGSELPKIRSDEEISAPAGIRAMKSGPTMGA